MTSERYPNLNWGSGRNKTPPLIPLQEAAEMVGESIIALPPELRKRLGAIAGDGGVDGLLQRLAECVRGFVVTGNLGNFPELIAVINAELATSGIGGTNQVRIRSHVMRALSHLPENQEK